MQEQSKNLFIRILGILSIELNVEEVFLYGNCEWKFIYTFSDLARRALWQESNLQQPAITQAFLQQFTHIPHITYRNIHELGL